ncbi:MAG: hypothetical protein JSS44_01885 [Proteobacteria bacterium]|nr:hypothetical protein [Pseudomonadota bacterium]
MNLYKVACAVALGVGLLAASTGSSLAEAPANRVADSTKEAPADHDTEIYENFLNQWTGKDHRPINVDRAADALSQEGLADAAQCAKQADGKVVQWAAARPIEDLGRVIVHLPYVHFVDRSTWKADDPRARIAAGETVDSAVEAGFAHGLLTLSAISYDATGQMATFTYAFVCGGLCGNGGSVVYRKTEKGWVQGAHPCGGWIS